MLFLTPDQQPQSTEGNFSFLLVSLKIISTICRNISTINITNSSISETLSDSLSYSGRLHTITAVQRYIQPSASQRW